MQQETRSCDENDVVPQNVQKTTSPTADGGKMTRCLVKYAQRSFQSIANQFLREEALRGVLSRDKAKSYLLIKKRFAGCEGVCVCLLGSACAYSISCWMRYYFPTNF
jgi:hypothetical protein